MDILALESFIAVAEQKSFSKASDYLFVTQPAISKRVASLEEDLNTKLFNRINRQISLTEAGKQLLPRAKDLVIQAKDMQRYASNLSKDVSGKLSIAISHHVALYRMPPIIKEFNGQFPHVDLDIRFEDSEVAFNAVEQGEIEFAVITLPKELPQNLQSQVAWHDPLEVVVGQGHELTQYTHVDFSMLANFSCVLPTIETETHQIIQREFNKTNLKLKLQMSTNNLQSLKMLVQAGLGWSLLPKTMIDDQLSIVDCGKQFSRDLGLVLHKKRILSNSAKEMLALIVG